MEELEHEADAVAPGAGPLRVGQAREGRQRHLADGIHRELGDHLEAADGLLRRIGLGDHGDRETQLGGLAVALVADHAVDAETTPLRDPEHYQYDFNLRDIAELWRRGSVVASWLLDLTAKAMASWSSSAPRPSAPTAPPWW